MVHNIYIYKYVMYIRVYIYIYMLYEYDIFGYVVHVGNLQPKARKHNIPGWWCVPREEYANVTRGRTINNTNQTIVHDTSRCKSSVYTFVNRINIYHHIYINILYTLYKILLRSSQSMSWLNSKWISHPWLYIYRYRFALWEHFFDHSDFWHACRARSLGCQALNCSPSLLLATIHQRFPRRRNMDRKSVYSTGGYP